MPATRRAKSSSGRKQLVERKIVALSQDGSTSPRTPVRASRQLNKSRTEQSNQTWYSKDFVDQVENLVYVAEKSTGLVGVVRRTLGVDVPTELTGHENGLAGALGNAVRGLEAEDKIMAVHSDLSDDDSDSENPYLSPGTPDRPRLGNSIGTGTAGEARPTENAMSAPNGKGKRRAVSRFSAPAGVPSVSQAASTTLRLCPEDIKAIAEETKRLLIPQMDELKRQYDLVISSITMINLDVSQIREDVRTHRHSVAAIRGQVESTRVHHSNEMKELFRTIAADVADTRAMIQEDRDADEVWDSEAEEDW